ncbi:MAG: quinoprotein dehydrogenase-associated SoxYZ-like carrier [Thiolinea sp.]
MKVRILLSCCLLALATVTTVVQANAESSPVDPLNSPQWSVMHQRFLGNGPVVFDERVEIMAPASAEDSLNVPVSFRAVQLGEVEEIVVFADLNPLPLVLKFHPGRIEPNLSFRMKLQQGSPLRVAARTPDGVWHVGAVYIDAAGGGCTLPSVGVASGDWMSTLGHVSARLWEREQGNRLRVKVMHPMDTGLADGVPKFHIKQLQLKDTDSDAVMGGLELFEPVSENPMLSLDVGTYRRFLLDGRDNNGNRIEAKITQ